MNTLNKLSIVVATTALLGGLSSCNSSKSFDLQTINDVSLHIGSFGLASSTDSTLANVSFSITNKAGEGLVTNDTPLPYQKTLEKVTIPLRVSSSATSASIAIGDGTYEPWSPSKTYDIPADVRSLRIKIARREPLATDSLVYIYQVKIRQYINNPEAITWNEDTGYNSSSFPASGILPNGVAIQRQCQYNQSIYALGSDQKVYKYHAQSASWNELGLTGIADLLGILPENSQTSSLIVRLPNNKMGIYRNGALESSTLDLPSNFPSTDVSLASFSSYQANYIGGQIRLITANAQGELQTWFYTKGSSRFALESKQDLKLKDAITSSAIVALDNSYYLIANTATGIHFYSSSNARTWKLNSDEALSGLSGKILSSDKIRATTSDGKYYLLLSNGKVFVGEPRKGETN